MLGSALFQFVSNFLFGNFRTESIVPAILRPSVTFIFYIFWRIASLIFFSLFILKPSGNRLHIQLGFFFSFFVENYQSSVVDKVVFYIYKSLFFYFLRQLLVYQFRTRPLSFSTSRIWWPLLDPVVESLISTQILSSVFLLIIVMLLF